MSTNPTYSVTTIDKKAAGVGSAIAMVAGVGIVLTLDAARFIDGATSCERNPNEILKRCNVEIILSCG